MNEMLKQQNIEYIAKRIGDYYAHGFAEMDCLMMLTVGTEEKHPLLRDAFVSGYYDRVALDVEQMVLPEGC